MSTRTSTAFSSSLCTLDGYFSVLEIRQRRETANALVGVSCGHDVSGADHWLHRDGHVSDRHVFFCNPLQHQHSWTHEGNEEHCVCWKHRTHIDVGAKRFHCAVDARLYADTARITFPHSVGSGSRALSSPNAAVLCSGARVLVARSILLPMHGSVDQDADLDSTPDFDSSQAESSSQLAPNVTVGAKQFRHTEVSFQPGYRCNMKCVVYIRKELCNMSCCHVARPCSNGSISARRRVLVYYFPSPGRTTGLTMDSRDDLLHTALIYDSSRSASQCASCQPDFFDLVILVLVCPSPMVTSTTPCRRASKVSRLHDRHGKDWFFALMVDARASISRKYFHCWCQTPPSEVLFIPDFHWYTTLLSRTT